MLLFKLFVSARILFFLPYIWGFSSPCVQVPKFGKSFFGGEGEVILLYVSLFLFPKDRLKYWPLVYWCPTLMNCLEPSWILYYKDP